MGYVGGLVLKGKFWHYRFKLDGTMMRGSTKCRSEQAARKWLAKYRQNLNNEGVGIRRIPTLSGLLKLWGEAAALTNKKPEIKRMQSAVANHMSSLTKVRIDRITTDKVRAILNDYLESQAEDTKRRHTHTKGGANALLFRLSSLMAFAVREGYLRRKPYTLIRFKKQRKPRAVVRVNQTVPFMDAVDNNSTSPDQVLAVALMIGLGLRESEALGIRWEYINLEQKEVTIGRLVDGQFETKGGEARKLTLPTWLTKRIRDRWKADGKPDDGLVLPGPAYDVAHSQGFTKKLVEKAGRAIKIRGLTPHRLRASFISQMVLEAIRPIAEVQLMVGHKHYQTTMGYVEGFNQNRNAQVVLEELQGFKRVPKKEKQPQKKSTKSPKIKTKK